MEEVISNTFEVQFGLGLAPSKLSDCWTNCEVPYYFLLFYARGDFFPSCFPVCLDKYLLFWAGPANALQ